MCGYECGSWLIQSLKIWCPLLNFSCCEQHHKVAMCCETQRLWPGVCVCMRALYRRMKFTFNRRRANEQETVWVIERKSVAHPSQPKRRKWTHIYNTMMIFKCIIVYIYSENDGMKCSDIFRHVHRLAWIADIKSEKKCHTVGEKKRVGKFFFVFFFSPCFFYWKRVLCSLKPNNTNINTHKKNTAQKCSYARKQCKNWKDVRDLCCCCCCRMVCICVGPTHHCELEYVEISSSALII